MKKQPASGKKCSPDAELQSMLRLIRLVSSVSTALASYLVYTMFFKPAPTPVLKREQALMNAADTRHELRWNQQRVIVYSWGSGPLLVLIHGWGARASRLCHFVPTLTALGYRVLAVDAPAHGQSSGKRTSLLDLKDMLIQLQQNYGPVEGMIAHSFGALALVHSLAHGLEMNKAVLISMPSRFADLVERYAHSLKLNPAVHAALKKRLHRKFALYGADFDEVARHFSPVYYASTIKARTLILHDQEDKQVPFVESAELAAAWPQATFIASNGLGHQRILTDAGSANAIATFFGPAAGAIKLTAPEQLAERMPHGA